MITRIKTKCSCMYNGEKKEDIYNKMIIFGEGLEHIPVILEGKNVDLVNTIKGQLVKDSRLFL